MALESLGIVELSKLLVDGKASSLELVDDCLKRIDDFEPTIKAWAWIDPEYCRKQARVVDEARSQGKTLGRLHGIPIGLKDIIDTKRIPTEYGSIIFKDRVPTSNASVVERLQQHGAIMMGKTVTASLATLQPGPTTNPHNAMHTPGGSSSGSAAAVASFMVPGSIGTQTNGSVIRPAAFCGVVGYKPSYGLISRTGILRQSPFLDQVGVFARSVEDAALLAEVLIGNDGEDPSCADCTVTPSLQITSTEEPPVLPRIGMIKTARWTEADNDVHQGFEELNEALQGQIEEVTLPSAFDEVWSLLATVNSAEIAAWYGKIYDRAGDKLDALIANQIMQGREVKAFEYIAAMAERDRLNNAIDEIFDEYDFLITPSAVGQAPEGIDTTGDPMFCTPWTFCGLPTITLPLLQGSDDLPIGVQLVGQRLDDARLLRGARWLNQQFLGEKVI